MLKVGEKFPVDVLVTGEDGEKKSLSELISLPAVIYFYPKDSTPGCTDEACSLRDFNSEIKTLGYSVVGISSDSQASHAEFKQKNSLNFLLLSDEDHSLQEAVGVWIEKNMYGKKYMGTLRATFVVDSEGNVLATWGDETSSHGKVETKSHGEQVLNFLTE